MRLEVSPELLLLMFSNNEVSISIFKPSKLPNDEALLDLFRFIGSDINNENDAL